jgi:hypothetical protein
MRQKEDRAWLWQEVANRVGTGMEIEPRLVVFTPEFAGFVCFLILVEAKPNQFPASLVFPMQGGQHRKEILWLD